MNNKNGQSIAEYALVLALVLSALLGMQVYIQRGLQARFHDASRMMIDNLRRAGVDADYQYEPYYTNSEFAVGQNYQMQENLYAGAGLAGDKAKRVTNEVTDRRGSQILLPACAADGTCP